MNFHELKEIITAEAERLGLQEYDLFFMESESNSTETLKDEISSFSSGVKRGIGFRCIINGHIGAASTELFTKEELQQIVKRAVDNAKNIESDDEAIIFKGSEHYAKISAVPYIRPTTEEMKHLALSLQKKTYAQSEQIADGTQSGVFTEHFRIGFVNSNGLVLSHESGISGAYVQAVVHQGEESQAGFDFSIGLQQDDLATLPQRAVEEAISSFGAKEIESGKYDVIFSGKQMKALLSAFSSVFSAKNAQLGFSLLKGKETQQIASKCVTLVDAPLRQDCPMQIAFDGEGVATYSKKVVENGSLNTLLYDLASAYKEGKSSTGNGQRGSYSNAVHIAPYSFYFQEGTQSLDDLFEAIQNGLYITEMKGLHAGANAVTGDFSIESAGFMIRNGKRAEAIKSFTVAGNFFEMLMQIEAFGNTVYFGIPSGFTNFGSPDVWVRNMSVAGK